MTTSNPWTLSFLTDFGPSTAYVGVMKGVALKFYPECRIVDLCHTIPPQNIITGSWELLNAYSFFPSSTVFVCVVDPGVGSSRNAIVISFPEGPVFVGPDNGLLFAAAERESTKRKCTPDVFVLKTEHAASHTFHGRDIFSPAGAMIVSNKGNVPSDLVKEKIPFSSLVKLPIDFSFVVNGNEFICRGIVVSIDHYGNVITSISLRPELLPCDKYRDIAVEIKNLGWISVGWHNTYSEVSDSSLFLIVGSSETFELSVSGGNAKNELDSMGCGDFDVGSEIEIIFKL